MTRVIHPMHCENKLKVRANAASSTVALALRAEPLFGVSSLRASIDFREGPATEWLGRAGPIAKQLNEESTRDGSAANNRLPTNNGD